MNNAQQPLWLRTLVAVWDILAGTVYYAVRLVVYIHSNINNLMWMAFFGWIMLCLYFVAMLVRRTH